jgi:Lon protease-like protein
MGFHLADISTVIDIAKPSLLTIALCWFNTLSSGQSNYLRGIPMQLSHTIPLFPLGLVLLPKMPLPLHIFEERYKLMIGECLEEKKQFGVVYFNGADIQTIGCMAGILKVMKRYDDSRLDILTRGEARFVIKKIYDRKPYLEASVTFFDDETAEKKEVCQKLAENGLNLLKQFAEISMIKPEPEFAELTDFKSVSFIIAGCEGFRNEEKQSFLEMTSTYDRLKKSVESLAKIIERTKITTEIRKIIGGNGNMTRFSSMSTDSD